MDGIFWQVHSGLPQEGPGSDESTLKALRSVPGFEGLESILDVACGPGRQTMVLARHTPAKITAVDAHRPFLEDVVRRAADQGFADRVTPLHARMQELPFAEGSFDLVWCEGALYIMGFREGLASWKRLLRPGGCIAVTEAVWLVDSPPQEALDNWAEYPGMAGHERRASDIQDLGYELLDSFILPSSDWMEGYYGPMQARIYALKEEHRDSPDALASLAGHEGEIRVYERHGASFGYAFYIMRRRG